MATPVPETVPGMAPSGPAAAPQASGAKKKKKKKKGKKGQPGKYSQLVIDAIRKLAEKSGSSLVKIYNEAKKVSWFDQQNGRMYLRYSIRALLLNDTLVQVRGMGANGSFKLNRSKFEAKKKKKKKGSSEAAAAKLSPRKKVAKKPAAAAGTKKAKSRRSS
ncbi:histone H1.10 [Denticeps clupeoides]|uniref:histone H1.10 n=1 Tax=Denticeps clupeoides TaxID=299321 RepID=UPI0010A40B7A|nr:histone H1x [Denticeps clupeoides]